MYFRNKEINYHEENEKFKNVQIENTDELSNESLSEKSNKIITIRLIIFFLIFIFLYFFLKSLEKDKNAFKKVNVSINQKVNVPELFKKLKTHQLIDQNNIRINKHLKISLKLEHLNYVHLKIENNDKNRWKVPNEILNKDYFDKSIEKNNNKIKFEIEYGAKEDNFYFNLFQETKNKEKNIFYSFTTEKNFIFSQTYINFESKLSNDDIYGFGERIHNFKLDKGIYTIWPTNQKSIYDNGKGGQNLYGHQPIGLHKTKYNQIWLGFVFLNSNAQDIQIYKNSEKETIISHKTIGGIIDYYIIVNNSPENVIKDIKFLLGLPPLPPYWALGYHQGGDMFNNINKIKKIYKKYKKEKIPIDSIWINENILNEKYKKLKNKPNSYDFPFFIREKIHSKDHSNFVISRNCDISNKNKKYLKMGKEYNIFVKSGFTKKNLISNTEKGESLIPDFLDPEIDVLWNEILFDIYNKEANFDGICLKNEPIPLKNIDICQGEVLNGINKCNMIHKFKLSYLPGFKNEINVLSKGGLSLSALTFNNQIFNNKPLINIYQSKHSFNYINNLKKRPFVMSQSNSFGSGKYAFHYFGDYPSKNEYIKYSISSIFTYNIFGIPFTGADICGYYKKANGDLCTRWYNIGSFYPFMRNNFIYNEENKKYPWSFGTETENIIKKDIQMRYSLIRYFYSQLFLISLNEKGGFFKPVMFEFPEENDSYYDIENRIMLGDSFLICPFFDNEENDEDFIFPNSNWNKYPTGENIINYFPEIKDNSRKIRLSGKKEELHIFLRGGYIVPMQNTFGIYIKNTYYLRFIKLNLIINPDQNGQSKGTIFYDNDEPDTLQNNKYLRVELEFKNKILYIKLNNIREKEKYIYRDNILNSIEIWRINEIYEENIINKGSVILKMKVKNEYIDIKGTINKENKKMKIIFINEISLFDLNEINMNC